jgi:hypothetical protein
MNLKIVSILAATCLCAAFCVSCGPPVTNINVGCSAADLIHAINTANNSPSTATTIHLASECVYEFTDIETTDTSMYPAGVALPEIISPITIDGQSATIRRSAAPGTPEFRLFLVGSTGDLTINQIFLQGGKVNESNSYGGAILNYGELSLSTCDVNENMAYRGGAIYNAGNFDTLWTVYYDNYAEFAGGAIQNSGETLLDRCIFYNNESHYGGAFANHTGHTQVNGSHFSDNSAVASFGMGGAICNSSTMMGTPDVGQMHVDNSTFDNNEAYQGGAVANMNYSEILFRECSFDGNSASYAGALYNEEEMNITRSSITNNTATQYGGAIFFNDSNASFGMAIGNTTFSGNQVTLGPANSGSAIYQSNGGLGLRYVTISENSGAIALIKEGGSTSITSSIIALNPAGDCGGSALSSSTDTLGEANLDSDGSCPGFTLTGDPLLDPLANNGGETLTHALQNGSPAIDAATEAEITIDQILQTRPAGAANDLGAFEVQELIIGPIITAIPALDSTIPVPEEPHKKPDYYWEFEGFVCSDMGLTEFYIKTSAPQKLFSMKVSDKNVSCYQQTYDTERYWCHVEKQPIGWNTLAEISFCVESDCTVINRTTLSESKCTSPDAPSQPEVFVCNTFKTIEDCKAAPGCIWKCSNTATAQLCQCENK